MEDMGCYNFLLTTLSPHPSGALAFGIVLPFPFCSTLSPSNCPESSTEGSGAGRLDRQDLQGKHSGGKWVRWVLSDTEEIPHCYLAIMGSFTEQAQKS